MVNSLLPNTDHQLCLVHTMRNAQKNFDEKTYGEFKQMLQEVYLCGSFEDAYSEFNKFLENNLAQNYSSNAKYLKERANNYLSFTKYPMTLRPLIRSTNAVEGINNAIEMARRASGGYLVDCVGDYLNIGFDS